MTIAKGKADGEASCFAWRGKGSAVVGDLRRSATLSAKSSQAIAEAAKRGERRARLDISPKS